MKNISPIKKRILEHLLYIDISKADFYKKTGISNGVLNSKSGLTEDTIDKYLSTYPEINTDWLLLSKGSMLRKNNEPSNEKDTDDTYRRKYEVSLRCAKKAEKDAKEAWKEVSTLQKRVHELENTLREKKS